MLRTLYCWTLRLHPPRFRREFAGEMLWIFDQAGALNQKISLLADGLLSVIRQWTARRGYGDLAVAAEGSPQPAGGFPTFQCVTPLHLRTSTLAKGGALAAANFLLIALVISSGANDRRSARGITLPQGDHLAEPLLTRDGPAAPYSPESNELSAPQDRPNQDQRRNQPAAFADDSQSQGSPPPDAARPGGPPDTDFLFKPPHSVVGAAPGPASLRHYEEYFSILLVLDALDVNQDRQIAFAEMRRAPERLRFLDTDGDGRLDPFECGLQPAGPGDPQSLENVVRAFMSFHRVHQALDADADGAISALEMERALPRLLALDDNKDGKLSGEELLPDPVDNQVALILRLDTNWDGAISAEEASNRYGSSLRDFLEAADHDQDHAVTAAEVRTEVRRRKGVFDSR
jgi:Ca2+-binding EF-hand superfamily protein